MYLSVKRLLVLTLAESGASLFTGITAADRIQKSHAFQGRRCTIRSARKHGLIDANDHLTVQGADVLSAWRQKLTAGRTWVRCG